MDFIQGFCRNIHMWRIWFHRFSRIETVYFSNENFALLTLWAGNPPLTGEFPAQMVGNSEIRKCEHVMTPFSSETHYASGLHDRGSRECNRMFSLSNRTLPDILVFIIITQIRIEMALIWSIFLVQSFLYVIALLKLGETCHLNCPCGGRCVDVLLHCNHT